VHGIMEDDDKWANQEELIDFSMDATTIDEDAIMLIDAMTKADFWLPPTSRDLANSSVNDALWYVGASSISNEAKGAHVDDWPCPASNTLMSSGALLSLSPPGSQMAATFHRSSASASLHTSPATPTRRADATTSNDKGSGSMVPTTNACALRATKRKFEDLLKVLPMRPLSAFSFYFRFEKHRIATLCTDRYSSDVESVMDQQLPVWHHDFLEQALQNPREFRRLLLRDIGTHGHGERLHSAMPFSTLVKCIAKSWSALPVATKHVFGEMAIRDRERYIIEMAHV
jgi:hypothetical protein